MKADKNDDELFQSQKEDEVFEKANAAILDSDGTANVWENDEMLVNESIEQINLFGEKQETALIQSESQTLSEQDSSVFRISSQVFDSAPANLDVNRIRVHLDHKKENYNVFLSPNQEKCDK